jgi:hypothetical protein
MSSSVCLYCCVALGVAALCLTRCASRVTPISPLESPSVLTPPPPATTASGELLVPGWWLEPLSVLPSPTSVLTEISRSAEPTRLVSLLPSPTSQPTPSPTKEQKLEPLDRTSPDSVLEWLKHGMKGTDTSVFALLAYDTVGYGPFESEPMGVFTKEQFLDEIEVRIASRPSCLEYRYDTGAINELWVATTDWNPVWDFGSQTKSRTVVFLFSDQLTKNDGLYLVGAWVTTIPAVLYEGIPCE